ncbi:Activated CDC42 kinase 1 [Dirofilaria immitis]|nr:Activated CDC42 kinase 1 [Dirofilaria immitis]
MFPFIADGRKCVYRRSASGCIKETDLVNFERKLCVELQLSRLEHFDHVTDDELKSYTGLSQPAIRRLRKDSHEATKVLVTTRGATELLWPFSENGGTSLIAKEEIKLMERLGEGSFAIVKRALWKPRADRKLDVAVKILRDSTPEIIEDLQREVTNMQKLKHPNLIQLYGIVFSNPAMMVVEFCDGGALIDRLRSTQKPVILVSMLIDYAQQIAKGMAYLESKNCVHRDLAARNVLLANQERVAKICDFGLMRVLENDERLYVMSTQKKVPFAWCPPESLRYRQFSHASDVWSFGVTLWELFSYGEEPWIGLRGAEVLTKLEAGERLPKPQRCSDELYDFISTCWSLKANLRPKFNLLKGILSKIMFMIAECCETSIPTREADLELIVNDRIIVIHTSGLIWYGQNVRTRKFGLFNRSSVHLRNGHNGTGSAEQIINPSQPQSVTDNYISKPVRGSFIHAGHGDINSEQSWGQPDYIDDIYLKNPILRKEPDHENDQKHIVPEIIPSLIDLKPPLWIQNQSNKNGTDSYIDPFEPFSVYSFDSMNDNESCQPSNSRYDKIFIFTLGIKFYDQPPLTSFAQDIMSPPSVDPTTFSLNIPTNISSGTPIAGDSILSSLQPTQEIKTTINSQQFSSLAQPTSSIADVASSSQLHRPLFSGTDITVQQPLQSLTIVQSTSASELPSTSSQHFRSSFNSDMQRTSNYRTCNTEREYQNAVDKDQMQNGKIPPPRPKSPNFRQITQNNAQLGMNSVTASSFVSGTSTLDDTMPHTGHLTSSKHSGQDSLDPFEISKTVKDITNRGGYSQLFKDLSTSAKAVSVSSLSTTCQMGMKQPCNSNKLSRPSTIFLTIISQLITKEEAKERVSKWLMQHTCYYWQPGHAKQSIPQQSSTYGSTPALLCDFHNIPLNMNKSTTNEVSFSSRYADNNSIVNSSKQRNSFLSDEILGMFDPLVAERVISDFPNVSASSMSNSDPVNIVLRNAAFADIVIIIIKIKTLIEANHQTILALRIELLSMGVAQDRGQAIDALQDCRWDLNAAAAALIS